MPLSSEPVARVGIGDRKREEAEPDTEHDDVGHGSPLLTEKFERDVVPRCSIDLLMQIKVSLQFVDVSDTVRIGVRECTGYKDIGIP